MLAMVITLCNVPYKAKAATTYSMSTSAITLLKGKKHKLKIVNAPKNAKIKWKTSNKFAVTVSKKGKLKAVNYGTATIKATYKKKNYYCHRLHAAALPMAQVEARDPQRPHDALPLARQHLRLFPL